MGPLTYEDACQLLSYDSATGIIRWRHKRRPNIYPGKIAGNRSIIHGYVQICVNGRLYGGHRIAWLIATGKFPISQIDHINGIRHDNRLENLREADISINNQNQRLPRKDSKTGIKGITRNGKGYQAYIRVSGIRQCLGTYKTTTEAHEAYVKAKRLLHKGNTL